MLRLVPSSSDLSDSTGMPENKSEPASSHRRGLGRRRYLPLLPIAASLVFGFLYGLSLPGATSASVAPVDRAQAVSPFAGLGAGRIERLVSLVDKARDTCDQVGLLRRGAGQNAELVRLFRILSHSDLARTLIARAAERRAVVCIDGQTTLLGYYRSGMRLIGIRANLNEGEKIAFLAHELSHVPQHGKFSDNRYYPASDLILLRRVREATAEAVSTWIAWELRQAGFDEPWQEKRSDHFYGDVARAFEAAWSRGQGTNQGTERPVLAARAAFDQWFAEPARLNLYDRMTVDHLERISADSMGLVPARKWLTHRFLLDIGHIRGRNFLARATGRRLTHPYYATRISEGNAEDLRRLLEQIGDEEAGPASPDKSAKPL